MPRRGFNITTKEGESLKEAVPGSGDAGRMAQAWSRCVAEVMTTRSNGIYAFGETIGTMTYFIDPQRRPEDALMHWVEGGGISETARCY